MAGAFGRVACLVALAAVVWTITRPAGLPTIALFFAIWTPLRFRQRHRRRPYNDIVARSIPSDRRSRMLALRFFGGGLLALATTAANAQSDAPSGKVSIETTSIAAGVGLSWGHGKLNFNGSR